jgi:serine/threonine protein kinase
VRVSENGERLGWFLVEEEVARTPSGRVLRARDTDLGVVSAIEVLSPTIANDAAIVKRFRDEVRQARSAEHPAFSRPLDVVMQDDVTFVVSEWIDGESLATRLTRGTIDVVEAMRFVRKACEALAGLHRLRLVHRGLSPEALIVRPDGYLVVVRMSAITPGESRQRTGRIDKAPYAAPEAQQTEPVTSAADVYSLGAILYALITGSPPDPTKWAALTDLTPDAPPILDEIVTRVLAEDPAQRPKDASALLEELLPLEALLGISDPHAAVGSTTAPPPRVKRGENDLPSRMTTRVTEPTHVMALPPYSQFSLEAPTGASILPEMLVDELLLPRGRASRERNSPIASATVVETSEPDLPTTETHSSVSGVNAAASFSHDDAPAMRQEPEALESTPVSSRAVPRPVTAAHHLVPSIESAPSIDDTLPFDTVDNLRAGALQRASLQASDEATELSLSPPQHVPTSVQEPVALSEDHTLPFDTVDAQTLRSETESSMGALDVKAKPLATAQTHVLSSEHELVPGREAHNVGNSPDDAATEAFAGPTGTTIEPLVDVSDDAEPLDDSTDDASGAATTGGARSERAASDDAAFTDAASDDAASTDAASNDAASNDAASNDAASNDAASNDAAFTDAASDDTASALQGETFDQFMAASQKSALPESDTLSASEDVETTTPTIGAGFKGVSTSVMARQSAASPTRSRTLLAAVAGLLLLVVVLVVIFNSGGRDPASSTGTLATAPLPKTEPIDVPRPDDDDGDDDDVHTASNGSDAESKTAGDGDGVASRPVDDDRTSAANLASRVAAETKNVERAMAKRGLRAGDDMQLDGLRGRAAEAMRRGEPEDALADLVAARRRASTIKVDVTFIEAKLERTKNEIKTIADPATRKKASALVSKAATLVKKKPTSAHVYLNRALKLVPDA